MDRPLHNICSCSISDIWKNYTIGTMPMAIVPIVTLLFPDVCLPLLTLGSSLALFLYVRNERYKAVARCAVFPYIAARILLVFTVFAALAIAVNLFSGHSLGGPLLESLCGKASVYLSLFTFVILLLYSKIGRNTFCTDCLLRHGMPQERWHLGHDYVKHNFYLAGRMLRLSGVILAVGVICRIAEMVCGLPQSLLRMAYVYVPVGLVVVDAIYVRSRYFVIGRLKAEQEAETMPYNGHFTLVRVLAFHGNEVLLSAVDGGYDTPLSCYVPYGVSQSEAAASSLVANYMDASCVIKFCYRTVDPVNRRSIEHYMCFVKDKSVAPADTRWVGQKELDAMFDEGMSHLLRAGLHRVYTVMKTSKMYDLDGHRLIDLKGYVPKFSFEELETTEVDFNDSWWMLLSKFNKDVMFYAVRRAWYQYVEGLV